MTGDRLDIVILGLSITSSWGNGHATTYRGLIRELCARGHRVLFLERDVPWYAENRDMPRLPQGEVRLYSSVPGLRRRFARAVREADAVIVGSYVPDGIEVGQWVVETARGVTAFYDIDTPVTLARLSRGELDYLDTSLIPQYQLYLSFTGGPTLDVLQERYRSPRAVPLYCSVDPLLYSPRRRALRWDLGYLGTYSSDRQPALTELALRPAQRWPEGRFVVAGPQYPREVKWSENVHRIEHLSPAQHRAFFNSQRYALNITRADMVRAGYSPSVRLFEAAACGTPLISDWWSGLDSYFEPGVEILISRSADDTLRYLKETPEEERRAISRRARARVLQEHTAAHRAAELEKYLLEEQAARPATRRAPLKRTRLSSTL